MLKTLERGPLRLADWIAGRYVALLDLAVPRLRRTAMINLRMALPEFEPEAQRAASRTACSGRSRVSWWHWPASRESGATPWTQWIRYEGYEHFENASSQRSRCALLRPGTWATGS